MRRRNFVFAAGTAALADSLNRRKLEEAAALIRRECDGGRLRAATLYVRRGQDTFIQAFGQARSPDAVFLIASITKPMTAAGVMVLADSGRLSLDDPVHRYIPKFDEGDRKLIAIRHLLTHSSGLPDMLPENVELRKRHAPLREFVERTVRTPLLFKPGTRVQYQSMGILLAADAAQRITRQPFPQFLEREVLGPLGMERTALGLGRFKIADTATCQVEPASDWDWNSPYWRNLAAPWGGAHSTGPDIARFLSYFLRPDGKVLKPATAAAMIVSQTGGLNEPRGLGFMVKPGAFGRACSNRTFGHSGSTGTIAWADPATGLVCVVLTTLPAEVSGKTILKPVSDVVSEAGR